MTQPKPEKGSLARLVYMSFAGKKVAWSDDLKLGNLTHLSECSDDRFPPECWMILATNRLFVSRVMVRVVNTGTAPDAVLFELAGEFWAHRLIAMEYARWLSDDLGIAVNHFLTEANTRLRKMRPVDDPDMLRLVAILAGTSQTSWRPAELLETLRTNGFLESKEVQNSDRAHFGKLFTESINRSFLVDRRLFLWEGSGTGMRRRYRLREINPR